MHTFLKMEPGDYHVGLWLQRPDGLTSFHALFAVKTLIDAFAAVNILNGGAGRVATAMPKLKEIDR
jgi:hypothetical protein